MKVKEGKLPKYLVRPSDHAVFVLVPKMKGRYAVRDRMSDFPVSKYNTYEYALLINMGWYVCDEKDLPDVEEKHREYMDYLVWHTRPDGHGGSKGGTIEEYLQYKKTTRQK